MDGREAQMRPPRQLGSKSIIEVADDCPGEFEEGSTPTAPEAEETPELPANELTPRDAAALSLVAAKGKKREFSSFLAAAMPKLDELCDVLLTWDNNYVTLKDELLSLRTKLASSEEFLTSARKRRERALSHLDRSESDLAAYRAENVVLRGKLAVAEVRLSEALRSVEAAETKMSKMEVDMAQLKEERAQMDIEAARASAIAEYKESNDFRVERDRIAEEARSEMMATKVDPLLEDECDVAFRRGFGKGFRLARRMPERSDLGVNDASDDDPDVGIDG
ncbi:hypothetical protein KSP39_PZI000726 [Platanthera zijinensis]|uniref:Uncharacterized protein n=1 Tax=Platanthera zijinensis TaxID=2320716 RepID=A0AAP0C5M4_9ASPA